MSNQEVRKTTQAAGSAGQEAVGLLVEKALQGVLSTATKRFLPGIKLDPAKLPPLAKEALSSIEKTATDIISGGAKPSDAGILSGAAQIAQAVLLEKGGKGKVARVFTALAATALGDPPEDAKATKLDNRSYVNKSGEVVGLKKGHALFTLFERLGLKGKEGKGPTFGQHTASVLESPGSLDLSNPQEWKSFGLKIASAVLKDGADLASSMIQKLVDPEGKTEGVKAKKVKKAADGGEGKTAAHDKAIGADDKKPKKKKNAERGKSAFDLKAAAMQTGDRTTVVSNALDALTTLFAIDKLKDGDRTKLSKAIKKGLKAAKQAAAEEKRPVVTTDILRAMAGQALALAPELQPQHDHIIEQLGDVDIDKPHTLTDIAQMMAIMVGKASGAQLAEGAELDLLEVGTQVAENLIPDVREKVKTPMDEVLSGPMVQGDAKATAAKVAKEIGKEDADGKIKDAFKQIFGKEGPTNNTAALGKMLDWLRDQGVALAGAQSALSMHKGPYHSVRATMEKVEECLGVVDEAIKVTERRIGKEEKNLAKIDGQLTEAKKEDPKAKQDATKALVERKELTETTLVNLRASLEEDTKRQASYKKEIEACQADLAKMDEGVVEGMTAAASAVGATALNPEKAREEFGKASVETLDKVTKLGEDLGLLPKKAEEKKTDETDQGGKSGFGDERYDKLLTERAIQCGQILADPAMNVVDKVLLFIMLFVQYSDRQQEMLLEDFSKMKEKESQWLEKKQALANKTISCSSTCDRLENAKDQIKTKMAKLVESGDADGPEYEALKGQFAKVEADLVKASDEHIEAMREENAILAEQPSFDTQTLELRIRRTRDIRDQLMKLGNDIAQEEKMVLERINRM